MSSACYLFASVAWQSPPSVLPLVLLLLQCLRLATYLPPLLGNRLLLPLLFVDLFDDFLRICLSISCVFYSIHNRMFWNPLILHLLDQSLCVFICHRSVLLLTRSLTKNRTRDPK